MSTTKIVIVVLILIGLLFIIFVARGALRSDPDKDPESYASEKKPGWAKAVRELFSSMQPKLELKQKYYTSNAEETLRSDDKQPFRTATFHLLSGGAQINYKDLTPMESDSPLSKLKDQECPLPNPKGDDSSRCSIVALKRGGKFTFACKGTGGCRVEVE